MGKVTCVQCGNNETKRAKIPLGILMIAFGVFIMVLFLGSDLPLASFRGIGNVVVGLLSIAFGLRILTRGEYRCRECGHVFKPD